MHGIDKPEVRQSVVRDFLSGKVTRDDADDLSTPS